MPRNLENFIEYKDKRNAHFLYRYVMLTHSVSAPYYTSVGYCLFVFGHSRASWQINERLHTFFFIPVTQEPSGNKIIFKMEKQNYVTPEVDVIEVEIEKGFAASNEDPEDGGWITSF